MKLFAISYSPQISPEKGQNPALGDEAWTAQDAAIAWLSRSEQHSQTFLSKDTEVNASGRSATLTITHVVNFACHQGAMVVALQERDFGACVDRRTSGSVRIIANHSTEPVSHSFNCGD